MNNITLSGRITKDPEIAYLEDGLAKCKITLAVNRSSSKDDSADFIPIEIFGKKAEYIANNAKKGIRIELSGALRIERYVDINGNNKTYTKVIAKNVKIIFDSKYKTNIVSEEKNVSEEELEKILDESIIP